MRDQLVENRRSVLPFTKKADILMVVYDITNMLSFKYLPDILEQIISSGTTPWMNLVLVGNKLDLDCQQGMRQVSSDMAFDLCRRYGFGMNFETSAKSGANVTELLSVALSRCEQDRIRELNFPLTGKHLAIMGGHEELEPPEPSSFAENIASFFGLGTRYHPDNNSVRVGKGSEMAPSHYGDDEMRTTYSSRFGPASNLSAAQAGSDYRVVRRAQSAPRNNRAASSIFTAAKGRAGATGTQTSFSPIYQQGAPSATSFAPFSQGPQTATSFAPFRQGGGRGGTVTSFAPMGTQFSAGDTQTSFAPLSGAGGRRRPERGSRAFVA